MLSVQLNILLLLVAFEVFSPKMVKNTHFYSKMA